MTFDYWRPRIITAKVIIEGGLLPRGFGVAWTLPYSHAFYCLPVPFNRIVGSFRNWYLAWRLPCEDDPINLAYMYGESQGFKAGNDHGYKTGVRHAMAAVREELGVR